VAVARRLTAALRDVDTIGRMGGDEFVVLIDGSSTPASPELVAQRLVDAMRQPFEIEGAALPITANVSIGISVGDRATAGELLRDADVALYQAKGAGKNQLALFDPHMQTAFTRQLELESELGAAIDGRQFRLVYQPIYNLADLEIADLEIVGVEALLRWDHPTLGPIPPLEFIPILEQSGQIEQVGRWVLDQACQQMSAWHSEGDTLDVSVNISGRQLGSDGIVDDIRGALARSGLRAGSLIIEVNETALMRNAASTAPRLHAISALGVRIAVDHFGTGYSSLAYLQQFPVDSIKIDRQFTNAITTSPESRALVRTLVQLGRDLGLRTLAEGVESEGEVDRLVTERVNEVQGFLLSRPLDPVTLEDRLLAPTRPSRPDRDLHSSGR
jgi:predicted signal transduction protein with EAL and GGDEF domain